jgi:hypothetical protein
VTEAIYGNSRKGKKLPNQNSKLELLENKAG